MESPPWQAAANILFGAAFDSIKVALICAVHTHVSLRNITYRTTHQLSPMFGGALFLGAAGRAPAARAKLAANFQPTPSIFALESCE
eukprot:3317684-Prymnesium_polylepis.1